MQLIKDFLSILLAVLIYGFIHSLLATPWVKEHTRAWLGKETERWYRLAYNAVAVISLVPVLALPALYPDKHLYSIPFPWAFITLAIQGIAVVAVAVGVWQTGVWNFLGLQQFLYPPKPSVPKLELGGMYRWVRHPLYSAGLVLIWLTPVMTLNILALNLGLSIYLVLGAMFEERKLLKQHGVDYEEYRQRTPMLIPKFESRKEE